MLLFVRHPKDGVSTTIYTARISSARCTPELDRAMQFGRAGDRVGGMLDYPGARRVCDREGNHREGPANVELQRFTPSYRGSDDG